MKHVLALTYDPKSQAVLSGICTQTIRPCSQKKKSPGDLIMFHGWGGKPYRSKWNWRTPYWQITQVIPVTIHEEEIILYPSLLNAEPEQEEKDSIAVRDGFKNYSKMYKQFKKMYGSRLNDMVFEIIRWLPVSIFKEV